MSAYEVILPLFRGPLDLLLHLIEEKRLEITQVSLAQVADQYLAYLSRLEQIDLDNLAEFIVVAAQLLLIKSRALLPQPPTEEEAEEEAGDDLVQRLIEYRRFKMAAQELRLREEQGLRAYARLPNFEGMAMPLEGISLEELIRPLRQLLQEQPAGYVGEVISPLLFSLPAKIRELEGLVAKRRRLSFNRLLRRARSRPEIIVTFLALLQLIKRRKVTFQQERPFGEIIIFAAPKT